MKSVVERAVTQSLHHSISKIPHTQEGFWKWLSGVTDNAVYPVIFLTYLQQVLPILESGLPRVYGDCSKIYLHRFFELIQRIIPQRCMQNCACWVECCIDILEL